VAVAVPESLAALGGTVNNEYRATDLVPASRPAVLGAIRDAMVNGLAEAIATFGDGTVRQVTVADLRQGYGVLAMAFHDPAALDEDRRRETLTLAEAPQRPSVPVAFVTLDARAVLLDCAIASEKIPAWASGLATGEEFSRRVHSDDLLAVFDQWIALLASPRIGQHSRMRLLCADGSYRWVDADAWVRDPDGEALIRATIVDIDDEVRAAASLARAQDRYQPLSESVPFAVLGIDSNGLVAFANNLFKEMTGLSVGEKWCSTLEEDEARRLRDAFISGIHDELVDVELVITTTNGATRSVRLRARVANSEAGGTEVVDRGHHRTMQGRATPRAGGQSRPTNRARQPSGARPSPARGTSSRR
jgi:PAS domain-containing protein